MELSYELLLTYPGLDGYDGLCHIRLYEQPGRLPVVIAGGLDDNPGTSITNAIATIARAVQHDRFADGREFRLIEYYPNGSVDRDIHSYRLVRFNHRAIREHHHDARDHFGTLVILGDVATVPCRLESEWEFRDPIWVSIGDIEGFLGCKVAVWAAGAYTARAVAGDAGEQLRRELAENVKWIGERILAELRGPT